MIHIKHASRGFTLIELLIVILIISIMTIIGVPRVQQMLLQGRITSETNNLVAALNFARSEAVNIGITVTVSARNNDWSKGFTVWADNRRYGDATATVSNNGTMDDGEIIREFILDADNGSLRIMNTENITDISFTGTGMLNRNMATSSVNLFVCSNRLDKSSQFFGRHLRINRIGRVVLEDNKWPYTTDKCL